MSRARIAEQLRATKALFGYAYSAAMPKLENWLTDTLARRIADYGFEDIREIGYGPQGFYNRRTGVAIVRGLHFYDYSSAAGGQHDANVQDLQMWPWATPDVFDIATNSDWFALFYARFTDDGVPYFVVVLKPQIDWKDTLAEALSMAFAAASFFIPGIGAAIAPAIFSPATIAAYPALTTVTANAMVQTVLSGGDVARGVQLAVAAYVGGSVGSFVKGVSDSQALGALANTAAKTAISGGDMQKALVSTVLRIAPDAVAELSAGDTPAGPALSPVADPVKVAIEQPGTIMDDYGAMIESAAYGGDVFGGGAFALSPESIASAPPMLTYSDAELSSFGLDPWGSLPPDMPGFDVPADSLIMQAAPLDTDLPPYSYTVPTGPPMMSIPQVIVEAPGSAQPAASPFDAATLIRNVTYAAQSALSLVGAWNAAKYGGINASARVTNPNGTQSAVSDSGVIMTRDGSGRVSSQKPPVGEARLTTTGNIVVNNGDGTYTLISSSGERRVIAYPGNPSGGAYVPVSSGGSLSSFFGGLNATHVGIGIGALGLLLALRKR